MRGDAECLASNRREVSRLIGEVERLTHGRETLQFERDESRAESDRLRSLLTEADNIALLERDLAKAAEAEVARLTAELAKLRPAEVVWACPKEWATGWRIAWDDGCMDVHGTNATAVLTGSDVRMLYGCDLPPQDGTYEIREPGRAVLIK